MAAIMDPPSIRVGEEQGVTFVELFFDLVFVFAVTQVTGVLAADLTGGGVLRALIVFWLVWWAWTQFTWSLNQADTEHVTVQLITLVAAGLAFMMATTVPAVTSTTGWVFAASYVAVRVAGIALQWRLAADDAEWSAAVRRWTAFSSVGLLAVGAAAVLDPGQRFAALGVAAVFDVGAALQAGSRRWRIFPGHFSERHGLFVIIALGESLIVAGAGASDHEPSAELLAVTLAGLVAVCGLWWTYFGWPRRTVEAGLAQQTAAEVGRFARDAYSFGHFPIIVGVIGFAVAIEEAVAHPGDPLDPHGVWAAVVGVGLFVGGTGVAVARATLRVPIMRLTVVGLLVVATPLLLMLPAWGALALIAALTVGLAVVERPLAAVAT
jgi:low temperature requirement protein LtrA